MSNDETGKPRPPVPLATIDRLADRYEREEMERLLAASDEELDEELKEDGFAADDAANVLKAALAPAPAKVVSLAAERQRRGRSLGWLAPVAAAAAAVAVLGGGGAALVALRTPDPAPTTTPTGSTTEQPPGASPEALARAEAEGLRGQAATECAAKSWGNCVGDLDEAQRLDPEGAVVGALRRLRARAGRALDAENLEAKPGALTARSLPADVRQALVATLAPRAGQPVRVVCARGPEPEHYCGELAAAMAKAGWVVTREVAGRDAGVVHGVAVTVAQGSDEPTQDAGEALADGLWRAGVRTGGPDTSSGGPGVTLTVGER